jgi:hypothetical protein
LGQTEALTVQCNIDQRGRQARIVTGAAVDAVGAVLILAGVLRSETGLIVAGAVLSLAGLFMVFEGTKGWCVVRAMGFKTRL